MARDKASKIPPGAARRLPRRCSCMPGRADPTRPSLGRAHASAHERFGGTENVSDILCSEVKDFVTLDVLIDAIRSRMTAGEPVDVPALCQIVNTKMGLARMLGLARKAKRVRSLQEVMKGAA